jgi:hypothetical protein
MPDNSSTFMPRAVNRVPARTPVPDAARLAWNQSPLQSTL